MIETILHTEEQKVGIRSEVGGIVVEIIEVEDNSSTRLYLTKLETSLLIDILQSTIDKIK